MVKDSIEVHFEAPQVLQCFRAVRLYLTAIEKINFKHANGPAAIVPYPALGFLSLYHSSREFAPSGPQLHV